MVHAKMIEDAEARRLAALHQYPVTDLQPDPRFDELAQLAAEICEAPVALVSLVDEDQLWFKARYNYAAPTAPREGSFCEQVVLHDQPFVVEDASQHPLFAQSPLVSCPSGIRFYAGMPLRTPDGEAIGVLCAIDTEPRPLTPQQSRALEILARQAMSQLELSRLAEAAREQASQLSELNQHKDRYLSLLAHDLRSAFHGIMAFSEVLDTEFDDMDEAAIRKIARYLNHASHSTYSLLENLLEWSMLQTGSMAYKPRWLALSRLLEDISNSVILNARHKDIDLQFSHPPGLSIHGDPNMLRSLIQNLLSNAIKFTPKGGVVQLQCQPDGPQKLALRILDSGVGMTEEQLANLFSRGVGQSSRGTDGEHGTGLGLSLCQQFVARHGGRIWAESTLGQGSTIHIELSLPEPGPQ